MQNSAFVHHIAESLTYKKDLSDIQKKALQHVKADFAAARYELQVNIGNVLKVTNREADTHFENGNSALRKTERRANAAIVNETDGMERVPFLEADALPKAPTESVLSTQQAMCAIVTRIFFELGCKIANVIPFNLYADLFKAELQDARGEYIDGVNACFYTRSELTCDGTPIDRL